jgi:hypothetical protein
LVNEGGKMEGVLEFEGRPVLCACRSSKDITALVGGSKSVSRGGKFVLLLENDASLPARVLPAFINARIRVADGISRSRSEQMEMLLLVSGTMNIGKALREHGAKDPEDFLLFATGAAVLKKFTSANGVEVVRRLGLSLDEDASGDVALTELSDK